MPANGTILVLEDDLDIQTMLYLALSLEGYSVVILNNGQEGLDWLEHSIPDLIFLDMKMPVMSGWTFLMVYLRTAKVRAPIIATSAEIINAKHIPGIVDFLAKPYDILQLKQLIASNIGATAAV
jgi:CheY-like chemotaxis protein